ncbi:MAG: hypothetical protein IPO21_14380 [Bacteroidales bacterium]|nr:hypothetical protein [Bacteroidales bacterium]
MKISNYIGLGSTKNTVVKPAIGMSYWNSSLSTDLLALDDKSGNNYRAKLLQSNTLQLDGTAVLQHPNLTGVSITEFRGEQFYKNQNCIVNVVANVSFTIQIDSITHYFVRVTNPAIKSDTYRYMGCGNGVYDLGGAILANGDNTSVFYEDGGTDFTGGLHGGEMLNSAILTLDGVSLDLADTSNDNYCKIAVYTELTDVYSNINNTNKLAEKSKVFTFDYRLKKTSTRIRTEATASFTVLYNYVNMYSAALIHDRAINNGILYDLNVPEIIPDTPYQYGTEFQSNTGYGATVIGLIHEIPTNEVSQETWMGSNLEANRKMYWGNKTTRVWQIGDVYDSETIAIYTFTAPENGNYALTLLDAANDQLICMPKYKYVDPQRYQVAFDFRINGAMSATAILLRDIDTSLQNGCRIEMFATGQLTCRFYRDGVSDYYAHTPNLSVDTWYRLELINRRLYLNGVLIKTFTSTRGTTYETYPLEGAVFSRTTCNVTIRNISYRGENFNFIGQKQFLVGSRGSLIEINTSTSQATNTKWVSETRVAFDYKGAYMDSGDNITDAHPFILNNTIIAPAGIISYLKLSDNSEYTFAEGREYIIYDTKNTNNLTIATYSAAMRVLSNFVAVWNIKNGFTKFSLDSDTTKYIYMPFRNGASIASTLTNYTLYSINPSVSGHNNSENTITLPNNGVTNVNTIEADGDYGYSLFAQLGDDENNRLISITKILDYPSDLTGEALAATLKYCKM